MQMSPAPPQPMVPIPSSTPPRVRPGAVPPALPSIAASRVQPGALAIAHSPASTPDPTDHLWQQVLARTPQAPFVYAVRTTGIFCRPSCPSRRPARPNVEFFPDPQTASAAGFRACLRCRPGQQPGESALIERLVAYLDHQHARTVPLAELARIAGCAPGTVQRLFTRVVGLSPRAWTNARRAETYRNLLTRSSTGASSTDSRITDAVYAAGFSGPSRAHAAAPLGMQAKNYRARGAGEHIGYAIADTAQDAAVSAPSHTLGLILVAATERGVCAVLFGDHPHALTTELAARFPRAHLVEDQTLAPHVAAVLAQLSEHPSAASLPLDLRGTAFQARVWAALRSIPRGTTLSYAQLAAAIGSPKAIRAVARACAQNSVAIVIPCHRVLASTGKLTGYRWGIQRKSTLLAIESTSSRSTRDLIAAPRFKPPK